MTDPAITRCLELQGRRKLRQDGSRWRFDHATANRSYCDVLKNTGGLQYDNV